MGEAEGGERAAADETRARAFSLYLVRHGETEANRAGIIQGHTNYPLTPLGRAQASATGHRLGSVLWQQVYSSDLTRAKDTAEIILGTCTIPAPPITLDSRLRELHFGVRETFARGTSVAQAKRWRAEKLGVPVSEITDNPDTPASIRAKQEEFLQMFHQDVLSQSSTTASTDANILLVSHGGWITSFMNTFVPSFVNPLGYGNCSITILRGLVSVDGTVRFSDDVAHDVSHTADITDPNINTNADVLTMLRL